MLGGRTPLHISDMGSVTAQLYKDEVLEPNVKLFRGAIVQDFVFMDHNAMLHRDNLVEDFLEEERVFAGRNGQQTPLS
ncbi:hypothetical protein TNCV_3440381 [Trichonephila clavipes]|uniref:Uncharacterized protein n=1 Tax=Trichonephila clavipes TaxID=2585209 RepID=A0A8X6W6C4_TRICX|nr:hypothetical protein TNCV_3440381 [Trichonephila clavipes]